MITVSNRATPSIGPMTFQPQARRAQLGGKPALAPRTPKAQSDVGNEPGVDQDELFKQLVTKYKTSLHYFVLKRVGQPDDAADITQQAFASAASAVGTFRGDAEISTWIFGIANNLTKNHVSRSPQRRFIHVSDDALDGSESPFADPCLQASQRESLALASKAMASLSDEMAEALSLVAIEGLSYKEAAEELEIPIGTVRSRVSRAREAVRDYFSAAGARDGF